MRMILGRVTSINVRKVLWVADELDLPYEREDWGLPNRDPSVPEFLALNPNAQVPVLIEDDFVLWESTAIMRHLAGTHRQAGLLPEDARQRALVDQWLGWQGSDLSGVWGYAVMALVRKLPGYEDEAQIAASLKRWSTKLAILDKALEGRTYMVGDTFTLADISIGLASHRWFAVDRPMPEFANIRAHYERMKVRAAGAHHLGLTTP